MVDKNIYKVIRFFKEKKRKKIILWIFFYCRIYIILGGNYNSIKICDFKTKTLGTPKAV